MSEDFNPQPVKGPDSDPVQEPEFPQIPVSEDLKQPSFWSKVKLFYAENKWYVWMIVVGLVIISALAAYAFWPRKQEPTEKANVSIAIDAPTTSPAGGEVIYRLRIVNQDPAKLVNMNLELIYDDGVEYISSSPKADNLAGTNFPVPDLASGENVVVIVKTLAQGDVNDDKRLVARLHYSFDNFNSKFTVEESHSVRLVAADVLIDIDGPETTNNNEEVTYRISYRNTSKKEIQNARIEVTYPDGFKFKEASPETSTRGQNTWNLNTMQPGDTGEITVKGSFDGSSSGRSYEFVVEFKVLDNDNQYFTQSSSNFTTTIESRPLDVTQRATSGVSDGVVQPGDNVTVELSYRNNTQIANTGVQIVAELNSESIDYATLKSDTGYVEGRTVTWNAAGENNLERLNSGDGGTVKYSFKIKDPATNGSLERVELVLRVKIKSNENTTFIPGQELSIKVASPAGISTGVEHSGGAIPPVVGVSSAFTITLSLSNSSNAFREGVLIGYVPTGINLDESTFTGAEKNLARYDSSTGKVTWNFGQLVAHAGNTQQPRTLTFVVTVTPTQQMLGKTIELFKDISVEAVDTFTEQKLDFTARNVDTSDLPGGSNQGRVQN